MQEARPSPGKVVAISPSTISLSLFSLQSTWTPLNPLNGKGLYRSSQETNTRATSGCWEVLKSFLAKIDGFLVVTHFVDMGRSSNPLRLCIELTPLF